MSDTMISTPERMIDRGHRFLDTIYDQLHRDPLTISQTLTTLFKGLHEVRREMPRDEWQTFCKDVVPKHGLSELIHQDPFTKHSARRPRGYAGDAELLDYIYGYLKTPTTPLGKHIFDYTTNTSASRGVRTRAKIIAEIVDRLAQQRGSIRVLSIACGHLREAEMSQAVKEGKVSEYIAFDQDADSLAHVDKRFSGTNIKTVRGSVAEILIGKHKNLNGFDFVYAAGLYDYLNQKLATKMTTWMFNATAPGGITLLTNFLRGTPADGYMEAFMDWELIYRDADELADTANRIPKDQIAGKKTYAEDGNTVVFVELQKTDTAPLSSGAVTQSNSKQPCVVMEKRTA